MHRDRESIKLRLADQHGNGTMEQSLRVVGIPFDGPD